MLNVENDPALLSVARSNESLVLRIDRDIFAHDTADTRAIEVLLLRSPEASATDVQELEHAVGKIVHINTFAEGPRTVVQVSISFAVEELELRCDELLKTFEQYTTADLAVKISLLVSLYQDAADCHDQVLSELSELRRDVGSVVEREARVADEKSKFFAATNPSRAAAFQRSVQTLRRIQRALTND
jgi:hypothetical protein